MAVTSTTSSPTSLRPQKDQTNATTSMVPYSLWDFSIEQAEALANQPPPESQEQGESPNEGSSYTPFMPPMVNLGGEDNSASLDPTAEAQSAAQARGKDKPKEAKTEEEKQKEAAKEFARASLESELTKIPKPKVDHKAAMKLIDPNYVAPRDTNMEQYFAPGGTSTSTQAPQPTTSSSMPSSFDLKTRGGVKG